jgi:hypothetical protein
LTNAAINNVIRIGQTFTPVEGNTGTAAANLFVRSNGLSWCIAAFNYSTSPTNMTVDLNRAGLLKESYSITNLWDGTTLLASNSFNVSLNAAQAKLFQLTAFNPVKSSPIIRTANISGMNFILSGTNGTANGTYYLMATTNLTTPLTNWVSLTTNSFDGNGAFYLTNLIVPGISQRFYLIKQ